MQKIWSYSGRCVAVSALALALAACQSMRGPAPVVQADIPSDFSTQSNGTSIAEQGYKDFFSDPKLVQVIDLALQNNRDLRTATLNIQRAQLLYRISENNQLPTIGASGDILRQATMSSNYSPKNASSLSVGVTAYELDFWGRVRSLKDNALDTYLATQSSRDATQIALISQVAQAWLNYAYSNANLKLAEQTLATQQKAYELNKKRFEIGVDSELPVQQARISVETARDDVASYKTQVAQAKNALRLLVGQDVPDNLLAVNQVNSITRFEKLTTGLPSDLLNNRPDVRAAEYQLSAAGANIGVAKASLFPTISLTGSAGFASSELSDLFKSGSFVWGIGPSLNLPIFDWGTRRDNIKISETDQQIALSNYEKAIQSAFSEVNDALATRAHIGERIAAQSRLVDASEKTYKLSDARFMTGIDGYLSVLDAQRSTYSAQQGLLALKQANLNNQIELYKALGGGIKADTTTQLQKEASSAEKYAQKQ